MEVYEVQYFSIMCMQENEFHPQPNTVFLGCFTADTNASHVVIIKKFSNVCAWKMVQCTWNKASHSLICLKSVTKQTLLLKKAKESVKVLVTP